MPPCVRRRNWRASTECGAGHPWHPNEHRRAHNKLTYTNECPATSQHSMTAHVPSPLGKIAALMAGVTMLALATVAACTPAPEPTIPPTWSPVPTPSEMPSPTATPTSTPSATRTPVPDPDIDSGRIVRLTHTDYTKSDPDWSPDGSKIVFQCFDDGESTIQSSLGPGTHGNHGEVRNWQIHFVWYPGEICVMNADGSSVK